MSGIEVAGLVLGAIPLILAGLEFYVKGIAVTRRYRRHEEEFTSLLIELKTENTTYINSINILLFGVVPPMDMADFLANPCGDRWKDSKFDQKLRARLNSSYDSYINTITQMNNTAVMIQKKLMLDPSGKPQFSEVKLFKDYYKRLKFSLNKSDYCDLVNKFRRLNKSLGQMTTQTTTIEHLHNSNKSDSRAIPRFNVINNRALGFYSVLSSGWKCPCHADHSVSLRLESRMEDISSDDQDADEEESMRDPFRILFRYSHIHHPNKISSPATPAWIWDEADVHITLAKQSSTAITTTIAPCGKGVRFNTTHVKKAVQAALDPNSTLQIQDLCSAISTLQQPERDVCLSLLASEHAKVAYGLLITPLKAPPLDPESWSVLSLRTALEDVKFTRRDRIRLAVTLASSVLQLHETPWLEDNWGKDNIFFIKRSEGKGYNDPFVSQCFDQATPAPSTANPVSRCRFIRNQTLFALGVSLIELWYGKPLDKLHKPEDGEMTGDARNDVMIKWNTADRLVEEDLGNDAGDRYCDAVRRCIRCDFNRRGSSLVDTEFQMAVYHGVVSQLKEMLDFMRVKS